jgi:hypothetical protein
VRLIVGILDGPEELSLDEVVRAVHSAHLDVVQLDATTPLEWAVSISALVVRVVPATKLSEDSVVTELCT